MRDGRSSRTAAHNALFRALERREPVDPLAVRFLPPGLRAVALLARTRWGRDLVIGVIDGRWPGVRTSVVARTHLIDGWVAELAPTVEQVVLLGAGFDSRAHRLPCLRGRTVIEVDHPATQARKRRILGDVGNVRYAATDFQRRGLDRAVRDAGWRADRTSLVLWEGVTNYLTEDAVDQTLRWCAGAAPGSHLVFTYVDRRVLDDPSDYLGATRVLATSRRAGEALTFGMAPAGMPAYLAERGLQLRTDVGAADYRRAHYGDAADEIRGHEFYRVAHAEVGR